jgi:hypothetical protein
VACRRKADAGAPGFPCASSRQRARCLGRRSKPGPSTLGAAVAGGRPGVNGRRWGGSGPGVCGGGGEFSGPDPSDFLHNTTTPAFSARPAVLNRLCVYSTTGLGFRAGIDALSRFFRARFHGPVTDPWRSRHTRHTLVTDPRRTRHRPPEGPATDPPTDPPQTPHRPPTHSLPGAFKPSRSPSGRPRATQALAPRSNDGHLTAGA